MNKKQKIIIYYVIVIIVSIYIYFYDSEKTFSPECDVQKWSEWSPCSTNCGNGIMTRERIIIPTSNSSNCSIYPSKETIACSRKCTNLNVIDEKIKEHVAQVSNAFKNNIINNISAKCKSEVVSLQSNKFKITNSIIDTINIDNIAVLNLSCLIENIQQSDIIQSITQSFVQMFESLNNTNIDNYLTEKASSYSNLSDLNIKSIYSNKILNYISNVIDTQITNNLISECSASVSAYQNMDFVLDNVNIKTINITNGAKAYLDCILKNQSINNIASSILSDYYQNIEDSTNITISKKSLNIKLYFIMFIILLPTFFLIRK